VPNPGAADVEHLFSTAGRRRLTLEAAMPEEAARAEAPASPVLQGVASMRASSLPGPVRELHRAVLRHFVATGAAPVVDDLKADAAAAGVDPDEAFDLLHRTDLVHLDSGGRVEVAYPFSGIPTAHTVLLDSGVEVYSMCAIDALGIPLMLGGAGVIRSSDPDSGRPVEVERRAGTWEWRPAEAVVLVAWRDGCSSKAEGLCPSVVFHADRAGAEAHLGQAQGLNGAVLGHDDAIRLSQRSFCSMLS
jgi:hypothetical protein